MTSVSQASLRAGAVFCKQQVLSACSWAQDWMLRMVGKAPTKTVTTVCVFSRKSRYKMLPFSKETFANLLPKSSVSEHVQ